MMVDSEVFIIMRKYTWKPDIPDFRDYKFVADSTATLPSKVDLRGQYSLIFDQGQLGSCTANAISMSIDFERVRQNLDPIVPSRLFIYYNERKMEGTIKEDAGAMIRDGIKSVANQGACHESTWKYNIAKFKRKPTKFAYKSALKCVVKEYLRLDNTNLNALKTCLASGYGFVFGFAVYSSFESAHVAQTGEVEMPQRGEQMLGGHAVFCVGYDDTKQKFICRNSWGDGWGDNGHFYIPYSYLTNTNLSDDFWTVRLV
jgi:C1A family cysteine protease